MNYKSIGDIGVNATIGHLATYGLGIAFPLSDNYPFDLIVIAGNRLFKAQVKTSSSYITSNSIIFNFCSTNWYTGESKKYTREDCDIVFGYDISRKRLFIFNYESFENRRTFTIRYNEALNKQNAKINLAENFEISKERIKNIFNFDYPDLSTIYFAKEKKEYEHKCVICNVSFLHNYRNAKYCSAKCKTIGISKVPHPSKEELTRLVWSKPLVHLSKDLGVSDNAIRKWCKKYEVDVPSKGYWNKIFAEQQKSSI